MKSFHYLVLGLVLIAGLGGSVLLIPNESDLGMMYYRGHQYSEARPLLEKRLSAGDRSIDVIMSLAELYVQNGEVDRAIELLHKANASNADRLELFQKVATFQKYSQQAQDYLATLETIEKIAGSEDGLRELAFQYRFANDNAKLIPALQTLVGRYKAYPSEFLELANLLAVGSRFTAAADVMQRFEIRHPNDVSPETVELFLSLLLDSGQEAKALDRASRWLARHRNSETIVRFAALMREKHEPGMAEKLLAPYEADIDGDPLLLWEWLQQRVSAGKTSEVFARLDRLRRNQTLPDDLMSAYIDLALNRGDLASAIEAGEKFGLNRLTPGTLAALTESALGAGQPALAYRIASAGGAHFLDTHPLLAARLAFARGDWVEAARCLKNVEEGENLAASDRVAVADLDISLGRQLEAAAQLGRVAIESVPDDLLLETARLYVALGKAQDGLQRFNRLRAARSAFPVAEAWALIAASSGGGKEVAGWIKGTPALSIPEPLLRDLAYVAEDHKEPELALAVSERLFREHSDDTNRLMLARALNQAGQPLAALPHLRSLMSGNESGAEEIYTAALLGAIRNSPGNTREGFSQELRAFWTKKLSRDGQNDNEQLDIINGLLHLNAWDAVLPKLETLAHRRDDLAPLFIETAVKAGKPNTAIDFIESELARKDLPLKAREERLYALEDYGGEAKALPYMRELAVAGLTDWISAYEEGLQKAGRTSELFDFWRVRLADPAISADEKRGIAYQLIDEAKPEWARSIFGELARGAAPASPDVAEWIFLWGPKPGREALDWLEGRARTTYNADRIGWLTRLVEAGASDRVVAILSAGPGLSSRDRALFGLYVRALSEQNNTAALTELIAKEATGIGDREHAHQLAMLAREAGGMQVAEAAYERLAALAPDDPEALHWLGTFDWSRARYTKAEQLLTTLLATSEGTYEDNYDLAEILWRQGKRSKARIYYGRALRLIERMPSPPVEARAAEARALFRCGYMQRGLKEYRAIIADQPRNGDLRADFAALLLEAAKYDEADDVLTASVDSGRIRVALLRAQLLSSTGRLSDAIDLVRTLADQNSRTTDVAAALGGLEQNAGRDRFAHDLISRAASMDPRNEDLGEALAGIEKARASQLSGETEFRQISGAQSENIVRLIGQGVISKALRVLFSSEQDYISIANLQRANGTQGKFDGIEHRSEAALEWEAENGTRIKGSLFSGFSAGSPMGGGLTIVRPDAQGSTKASIEIDRPDWDFAEVLAQGGIRDRVEIRRDSTLSARTSVQIGAAANRYDLPTDPRAAESVSAAADVNFRLLRSPQISLNYSLDAEYVLSTKVSQATDGATFRPLPLASREVHAGSVQAEKQLTRGLHATAEAGLAVDRLGGRAPFYTGGLTYDRFRHFGAHVDFDRRMYRYDSHQTVTGLRAGLFWIF
ncbi:MAG TPA: tetratricopeptide repeat protein [Bryobacteraceae bacterium]|nr:tetratricopeptide repeat protein [Bryobacteraceae bacterium]